MAQQKPVGFLSAPAIFFPNASHKCLVGTYDIRTLNVDSNPFYMSVTPAPGTSGPNIYAIDLLRVDVYNYYIACLANC